MIPTAISRRAALALAVGLLAACRTPPVGTVPSLTFAGQPPIELNVATIEVEQAFRPAMAPPYVDHLLPQAPSDAVRAWAGQRLRAVGRSGTARVIIEDGSVLEEALALTPGLRGKLTLDQSERYTLTYRVRVEAADPATGISATAVGEAQRSITVREDATLAERERTWFRLLEETTRDLDRQLEQNIRAYLAPFVRR